MYRSPPTRDLNGPFPNHPMSSGLLRYRSAPSSLLGEVSEDFLPIRAPSPETETMFARFLSPESPQSASGTAAGTRNSQFPPPLPAASATSGAAAAAEENSNSLGFSSTAMIYQHQNPVTNQQMVAMEADQMKNSSNLIRQSSSPAGLFSSHLNVENGYGVMRGINETSNEGGGRRLKSQLSFSSSRQSSLLSQISEIENDESSIGAGGGNYPLASWEESPPPLLSPNHFSSLSPLKRPRVDTSVSLVTENGELRNGLTHQFSMPKTSSEIAAIDKFLQFQDSVPCKIRAKRGCATHPRSIAERVRRTRISERMRKLQELVPNMDKQTNTADMLDLAVDYIKDLQKQVKTISDGRASCTCSSSKHKPYTNPTV